MFNQAILQVLSILCICTISSAPTKQNPKRSVETYPPYTCYECFGTECNDNPYNKTCNVGLSCFTRSEIDEKNNLILEKGCHKVPFIELVHCHGGIARKKRNKTNAARTCCYGNLCNGDEFKMPNITKPTTPSLTSKIKDGRMNRKFEENILTQRYVEKIISAKEYSLIQTFFLSAIVSALTGLVMILACFVSIAAVSSIKEACFVYTSKEPMKEPDVLPKLHKPITNHTFEGFWTSGSGSGMPALNQRSLSQDVALVKCIAQGRFGEVWQGMLRGEYVAVKIFSSVNLASWENEVKIFTNITLYHENVLGFKGSAIVSRLNSTELWLLTTYYDQGSLYDYLLVNTISLKQMIAFVQSTCSGLLHLHTEIFGIRGKPSIAHRDLKTRNILVTSYGRCVIADFGLAVVNSDSSSTNYPENYKVGTKRYMAPELLDESMKTNSFESYKRTDIYAFGLLLWEICSRCVSDDTDKTFRLAYHDCVPNNPNFEDMKQAVCTELRRPEIPKSWMFDEPLNSMGELMRHCWHKNPEVRYSAHRVKKNLDKIHAQIKELQ